MEKLLKRNIVALYVIKISHWLMLVMPVMLLFYTSNGLSVSHLFEIQAVYSVTIVAIELPSGYLADVWGRKNTIILGSLFAFTGYMCYSFSFGFYGFLFSEILLGIGHSFISGTDTALLYDTMLAMKAEDTYLKVEGRMTSVGNFAEAIAGVTGGFLAIISPRLPFIGQAGAALLAIPASFMLVEPKLKLVIKRPSFIDLKNTFYNAMFRNKALRRTLFLSSVIGASTLTMAWFVQPYFRFLHVETALYGILWTVLNASVGITAIWAYKIEKLLSPLRLNILIVLSIVCSYVSLFWIHSAWGLIVILFFYLIRGVATPVLKDYLNKLIASETRASLLSLRNLIIRGIFSTLGPFLGWATDHISLSVAFLMAGMTYFIFALPFLIGYFCAPQKQ